MIIGIESTAHTFGVGLVDKGRVLVNVKDTYFSENGGIIPISAAKHHEKVKEKLYRLAINCLNITEDKIEGVAFSQGPGLAPCLYVGFKMAKELASRLNVPLVGVNHCVAHLEISRVSGAKDPVLLYASGANTQIIAYVYGKYRIFGETLDLGIGNFIDKFARYVGIGFPGGPKIENEATGGDYIKLPYPIKGMDVSFSGILTKLQQLYSLSFKLKDLSFSLQETAFAMLVEASERAIAHTGKNSLVLGGGVSCNNRLKKMCKIMCNERGAKFFCPPNSLLQDNGAMIAFTGELMLKNGYKVKSKNLDINPRQRTDLVDIFWR